MLPLLVSAFVGGFLCACLIGSVVGYLIYRHKVLRYHFDVVDSHKLYRSGILTNHALRYIVRKYKIRHVVNLLEADVAAMPKFARQRAIIEKHHAISISLPLSVPPQAAQVTRFMALCDDPKNHPILVHCKQGVCRTGMLVAVYQRHNFDADNATIFANLPTYKHNFPPARYATYRDFILHYEPPAGAA